VISAERAQRITDELLDRDRQALTRIGLNGDALAAHRQEWRWDIGPWLLGQLTADDAARQTEPGSP
jgi:hypothetical protein